ncbi:glycoside hydrolase family 127 protein [Sediminibacillus massiliensis]|uniref:glycoside hydrolase family 127 protein n=1 Tax=Sediminibacillus massiliensis TaxID=1926277 RepID=UPI00098851ED|nr:glycoside hydrolase family 127 protein [Sediminibacillus massiliensis]
MKVETKGKKEVESFELKDIRITGGPFKWAMDLNADYLLQLEPDRFLARFREYAGLERKAPSYEGWESLSISGHTLGHYLSACSMMYASLGEDKRFKERVVYIVDELRVCQEAHGDGYVSGIPQAKEIFQEVAGGNIRSQGFDLNGLWAPLYTIHKLFAGLRDAFRIVGVKKALTIEMELADWLGGIFSELDEVQMEEVMACEYGGLNEVLADLYADTGAEAYLKLAEKFWHKQILDPLSKQKDRLGGNHANTQIPKILGLAKQYEITNNEKYKSTSEFFWNRVVNHHSYVIGGHSFEEYFGTPDHLSDRLGPNTTETCNTYNMLKLTKHLFEWNASAEAADYYERALFNHILSSQDPVGDGVTYCLSLDMGGYKDYNDKFHDFTCCVGTGMENHASHGNSIYFFDHENLYINQYIASRLHWKDKGVTIIQETNYPEDDQINIRVSSVEEVRFTLNIRYPYWAEEGIEININGEVHHVDEEPGSFIKIDRSWKDSDCIDIKIPMTLRLEPMPDKENRVAIMYGPLVLAGELGPLNDPEASDSLYSPVMIPKNKRLSEWIKKEDGKQTVFRTVEAGHPRDIILYPFYKMHDKMYSVYWDLFTEEEWERLKQDYVTSRKYVSLIEKATIDYVQPGEMQPERDHQFDGEKARVESLQMRKCRTAYDGWFSFELEVDDAREMMLLLTYAKELQRKEKEYDIFIDNKKLTNFEKGFDETARFQTVSCHLADHIQRGQNKITIKFQAHPKGRVRRVFGIRTVSKLEYNELATLIEGG